MKASSFKIVVLTTVLLITSGVANGLKAQLQGDTIILVPTPEAHSPKKATLYSTFLPGLGQVYNKNYWYAKVPVIYAGFGVLIYAVNWNNKELKRYKTAYNTWPDNEFGEFPSQDQLIDFIDYYRRNRDLSVIGMVFLWGLNIIEANVSGHFYNYDISPDLSLNLRPTLNKNCFNQPELGFQLALNF